MAHWAQLIMVKRGTEAWNQWRKTFLPAGESPDLKRADLHGADLRNANLYRANLRGADLSNADLRKADLGEADLSEANLSEADLREAILRAADCFQADFSGANLEGADMQGAIVTRTSLLGAKMSTGPQPVAVSDPKTESAAMRLKYAEKGPSHKQSNSTMRAELPISLEAPIELPSPQPELVKPPETPRVVETDQKETASHTAEIGKITTPTIGRERKLVIRPPELGKEYVEGERKERLSQYYEREPKLRAAAIALHGTKCMVCGFDFEAVYGPHGAGYVEVHHLRPISSLQAKTSVNPQTDMVVLCANCHRMIHRSRDRILSPDELRCLIRR